MQGDRLIRQINYGVNMRIYLYLKCEYPFKQNRIKSVLSRLFLSHFANQNKQKE